MKLSILAQATPVLEHVVVRSQVKAASGLLATHPVGTNVVASNPWKYGRLCALPDVVKFDMNESFEAFASGSPFGFKVYAVNVCAPEVVVIDGSVTVVVNPVPSEPVQLYVCNVVASI